MKIEDVEALEAACLASETLGGLQIGAGAAIGHLRAEAWHPIEKAEELGAKDGRQLCLMGDCDLDGTPPKDWYKAWWQLVDGEWDWYTIDGIRLFPTHFRFINPPEGA